MPSSQWAGLIPALTLSALAALIAAAPPSAPRSHFGVLRARLVGLSEPAAVTFDRMGRVLVADTGHDRIVVFERDGTLRATWGRRGSGAGQFLRPAGIAVAPDGRVYVSDTGNHRVQVLDGAGAPLGSFGGRGREPGRMCEPLGLAVDEERVLVADSGNQRVQVFDREGRFVRALDALDDAAGSFLRPVDVALEGRGRFLVVDALRCRITRFDAAGRLLADFGARGPQLGLFAEPAAIDVRAGRLFIADRFNHRVQELDSSGACLATFPGPSLVARSEAAGLFAPGGLAVSPGGDLIAVAEPLEDRVVLYGEAPDHSGAGPHGDHPGFEASLAHVGAGAGAAGPLLAVVDPELLCVAVYDTSEVDPVLLTCLGGLDGAGVRLVSPRDAAVDPSRGWIHVADPGSGRLIAFSLRRDPAEAPIFAADMARLVRTIELSALSAGGVLAALAWPLQPGALACSSDGALFVADERNGAIVVFDPRGRPVRAWTTANQELLLRPVDLALSPGGEELFAVDADACRVHVFDRRGDWLRSFGGRGSGPEGLQEPWGVLPLGDGSVLVTDRRENHVQVYDAAGTWLRSWGQSGKGPGEMHQPASLVSGPRGMLYLLDVGNRRGQVLTQQGRFVLNF